MLDPEVIAASERLVAALRSRGWHIATAESCTGGLLAGAITAVAGSSAVFEEGFVTYSNAAKQALLGVPGRMLDTFGAVSSQVAQAMAGGLRERTGADLCVSVTGIAGPGGATDAKPVGLVHFGVATATDVETLERRFGDIGRANVRSASVLLALRSALDAVERS